MIPLILFLNRFSRRPRVGGRESDEAYSLWEYNWGRELVRRHLEPAGDIGGKRILDIGCGLGGKTVAYGEGGAREVFGIDILQDHAIAGERFTAKEARAFGWGYVVGDAAAMPVKDAAVDTVVANDAMEHFSDPEGALREIRRVVRPGEAVWIFFTPHFSPLGSHLYDYIYMPWCHLLFRRTSIEGAIRRILAGRMRGAAPGEVDEKLERIMRSYDEDLNHMSIRRFFRILRTVPEFGITRTILEPAKFRFLKPLTRVPLARELITGTVICRLEKRG
ncbi:MAG: class I SAM-dependent methyltransferase [Chitinivibrionia bacterium]|nr:class I SAM-dependent methyltransferase [Chitinivibrionia bacterium]